MNINSNLQMLDVASLKTDYSYQREPDQKKIQKIASKWSDDRANIIHVSRRPDGFYVIDGNHTRLAYASIGGKEILCNIHDGLKPAGEAALFVELNTSQNKPNFNQILKAKAEAGIEPESSYIDLLKKVGAPYTLSKGSVNKIACHSALLQIYKTTTPDLMERAIRTALRAAGERETFLRVGFFPGLCSLVVMHPNIDDTRLINVINKTPASKIVDCASMFKLGSTEFSGGSRTKQFRKAYLLIYNRRLKNGRIEEE